MGVKLLWCHDGCSGQCARPAGRPACCPVPPHNNNTHAGREGGRQAQACRQQCTQKGDGEERAARSLSITQPPAAPAATTKHCT